MTPDDLKPLLGIVAELMGIFLPHRTAKHPSPVLAALMEKRERYLSGEGLLHRVGGEGSDRQSGRRRLLKLQAAGLLQIHRSRSTEQRCAVSLRRIDAALKCFPVAISTDAATWKILERLGRLDSDPKAVRNGSGASDHDVMGPPADSAGGKRVGKFEADALPLLIRGWVSTMCDTEGRIAWTLEDSGREALRLGKRAFGDSNGPGFQEELADEFTERYQALLWEREHWAPVNPQLVYVPLSSGLWGRESDG